MLTYYVELYRGAWFKEEPFIVALYWRCTNFGPMTSY